MAIPISLRAMRYICDGSIAFADWTKGRQRVECMRGIRWSTVVCRRVLQGSEAHLMIDKAFPSAAPAAVLSNMHHLETVGFPPSRSAMR